MADQNTNVIDISKFFGGKTLSSADVRVNTSTVLKTEPSFIAAPELARLLDVIATSTEESKTQVEEIKSIERIREREIITREQSDSRFQQALKSMMDDVAGLKNVYKSLLNTLQSDRKLKEEELRDRENKEKILKAEQSEVQKGMQYQASMVKPTKSFMTEYDLSGAQGQQEEQKSDDMSGLMTAMAAAGTAGLIAGFNPGESGGEMGQDTLTPGSVPGGSVSVQQLVSLAKQAGFNDKDAATMAAIAMAESGGNSKAHNKKPPDNSYGLWQINMIGGLGPERRREFGIQSNDQLFDPATNARAAKKVYQSQGFGAWTVYKTGAYKNYLKAAQQASENKSSAESGEKKQQSISQSTNQSQTKAKPQTGQQTSAAPGTSATGQQTSATPGTSAAGQQMASAAPRTSAEGQQMASAVEPSMEGQQIAMGATDEPTRELTPNLTEPLVESSQPDRKVTPDTITPSDAGMAQNNVQIAVIPTTTAQTTPQPSAPAPSQGITLFSPVNSENLFMLSTARELNIA